MTQRFFLLGINLSDVLSIPTRNESEDAHPNIVSEGVGRNGVPSLGE